MERLSRDAVCMQIAEVVSQRGTCGRAQVGAILARKGRVLATGYNGPPSGLPHCLDRGGCSDVDRANSNGCPRSVHAEANCIAFAARYGIRTQSATLYCTHLPCLKCAELIINAGIRRVVYATDYRIKDGEILLQQAGVDIIYYGDD
jgi:dCMP deaminase